MTFERKLIAGIEDIKALSFECTGDTCKYRITVSPDDTSFQLPTTCPHGHRWISGQAEATMLPPLLLFTDRLAKLRVLAAQKTLGYRILLEFDEPKAS